MPAEAIFLLGAAFIAGFLAGREIASTRLAAELRLLRSELSRASRALFYVEERRR